MADSAQKHTFLEFFAGGGMCRAGLGNAWRCLFANDFDAKKGEAYVSNWGAKEFRPGDIHALTANDIPGCVEAPAAPLPAPARRDEGEARTSIDLAWASFPCQDLSLAGAGAGLKGARSGAFWGFRNIVEAMRGAGRAPKILVLENVVGALTSNGGGDFRALCDALQSLGYVFGAMTIDAAHFVPQSRPRLFIVALRADVEIADNRASREPAKTWSSPALLRAHSSLPPQLQRDWRWWRLPAPPIMNARLIDLVEREPLDVRWHSPDETARLISLMSAANRLKLDMACHSGARIAGSLYRRTRVDAEGRKIQRAEVRFDGIAGCLRTPGGGSSRQFLVLIEEKAVRTRLMSGREAARLMGLPEDYRLPARYNDAYHLVGDGVAVPVVRFLSEHLLTPLCAEKNAALLQTAAE